MTAATSEAGAAGAPPEFVAVGEGADVRSVAVRRRPGRGPAVVWLGGLRSDMRATKATALDAWGERTGRAVMRMDYSGHGESPGAFEEGTIGRWLEEARAVLDAHGGAAPVLVGSSLGGWLALLAARGLRAEGRPVGGLVLIAPAVDFTERLMWSAFPEEVRETILTQGRWLRPSAYGDGPYPITRGLIEEGRSHLLLGAKIEVGAPVRILQGARDPDVPWRHALALVERLAGEEVGLTLVPDGDHRLSREADIIRLIGLMEGLAGG